MKRPLIIVAALAVVLLSGGGVALAQERLPIQVTVQKACGVVTLTFVNPNKTVGSTHGFRWNAVAGKVATGDGARTGLVTVPPGKTVKETIRFTEDEFDGEAAVTVAVAFGPDSDIQPRVPDVYPVDTDCLPPAPPTPTPTTTPTATPAPTTTAAPTTTVVPPAVTTLPAPPPRVIVQQIPVVPSVAPNTGGGPA